MTAYRRLTALAFALAAAPLSAAEPNFDYDRGRPLNVAPADVAMRNVTFADAAGQRTEATLVTPARPGRHPAILFVHWFEPPSQNSNRTQFLPDALELGRRGVVSLLVDTLWTNPRWFQTRDPANDFASSVEQVKNLRRALDVLVSLDVVDPERIVYVGHDFGAMYGAIVMSVDRRPKGFVFMAGTRAFSDWFLLGRALDAEAQRKVQEELAPLDPIRHMGRIGPVPMLFQFASKDPFVTREAAEALAAAARGPKEVRFYDCGHALNADAMHDRIPWLLHVLGMDVAAK
jgi:fermentation-respiration switch protein FrsA (DUF1100 family)